LVSGRIKYSSITQNNANPALRKKMPDEPRLFFIGKNVTLTTRGAIEISMAETLSLTPQWENVSISALTMVGAIFIPQIYIILCNPNKATATVPHSSSVG
jgi:hypothetical protein